MLKVKPIRNKYFKLNKKYRKSVFTKHFEAVH